MSGGLPRHAQSLDVPRYASRPTQGHIEFREEDHQLDAVPSEDGAAAAESAENGGGEADGAGDSDRGKDALDAFLAALAEDELLEREDVQAMAVDFGGGDDVFQRFLVNAGGDFGKAKEMLVNCAEFRAEKSAGALVGLDAQRDAERFAVVEKIRPWWTGQFIGIARNGCPVQYHRLEFLRPKQLLGFSEADLELFYLWWMENSLGLQRVGQERLREAKLSAGAQASDRAAAGVKDVGAEPLPRSVEIYDCRNLSYMALMGAMPSANRFAAAVGLGTLYYPDHLHRCIFINAPRLWTMIWSAVSLVMTAESRSRTSLYSDLDREALAEFLDEDTLEEMLSSIEAPDGR